MSWRFRQSFKLLPGLKLNLSKTGLSASIGGAPFTLNLGPRGLYGTASIPGAGVSFRQRISNGSQVDPQVGSPAPPTSLNPNEFPHSPSNIPPAFDSNSLPLQEIRSGSTELLTSDGLRELKSLIESAYEERETISRELSEAKQEEVRTGARFRSWNDGILLKYLLKSSFGVRKAQAELASARARELEEQLGLTTISTQVQLAREQAEPFFRMRDDFAALAECGAIWDIKAERATDKLRERTAASISVSRERVRFLIERCELIQWEQGVPHLQNANGGDIFLYPGFILYRASRTTFSVIDFHNVKPATASLQFHETEPVPNDAKIVGQTWTKTNKDGSPDRRFADNHQIPIARYGELTLKSDTGLWESYMFSNPERLEHFVKSWTAFVASFHHGISLVVSQVEAASPETEPESPMDLKPIGAAIHFECKKCGQPIEVNCEATGQEFRCPGCGERLVVPAIMN